MNKREFRCRRCGRCCRWPGAVKLLPDEVDAIAAFLGLPVGEFLDRRTVITPDRRHLSLKERADGSCEFLTVDAAGLPACAIESVKPAQCRGFPLRWNFPGWERECAGGLLLFSREKK